MATETGLKLHDLKDKYDRLSIEAIESEVQSMGSKIAGDMRVFFGILFYLESTSRFRENHRYKAAQFGQWLYDHTGITYGTYHKKRKAYHLYPAETEAFGVGVVCRAISVCKPMAVSRLFKEIPEKAGIEAVNKAIESHRRKDIGRKHKRPDRNVKASDLRSAELTIERQRQAIVEKDAIINELEDQVRKLKATVERLKQPVPE